MGVSVDLGDIVAAIALVVSTLSAVATLFFYMHQQKINETTERLNQLLIKRETEDDQDRKKADVSANFIKIGKNGYRLKVFNRGKCTARNVQIAFPEGNDLLIETDVSSKFPAPMLEQHQYIELIACVTMGSPPRMVIKLIWDDDSGVRIEKIVTPTVF